MTINDASPAATLRWAQWPSELNSGTLVAMQIDPEKNSSTQPSVPLSSDFSAAGAHPAAAAPAQTGREIGGPSGPEPTRFGDWERKGRCIDF